MNMARNTYGMHAPIKMAMERSLVIKARGPSMLPRHSNLGLDILMGKDETIDFEDFLNGKNRSHSLSKDSMQRGKRLFSQWQKTSLFLCAFTI